MDFIRYSLSNEAILTFIEKLNCLEGITIRIDGEITELSQQEYNGKRVLVTDYSAGMEPVLRKEHRKTIR